MASSRIDKLIQSISVLIVEDNQYMRKVVRNILVNIGVKNIHEAGDGIAGLEAIRMFAPDLVILDWEMPLLNGAELVRIVRSPGPFPVPDVPIIMLTGHAERWRVIEASRLGVNEFLKKPVSGKALLDRIMVILTQPRAMVRLGDYYGPEPPKLFFEPAQKLVKPAPALTHNPFAALAQKIEGGGEAAGASPQGEDASPPEAATEQPSAAAAESAAPPAQEAQTPPAAHEAAPGAPILGDPGVGSTTTPSDAGVASGEPEKGA